MDSKVEEIKKWWDSRSIQTQLNLIEQYYPKRYEFQEPLNNAEIEHIFNKEAKVLYKFVINQKSTVLPGIPNIEIELKSYNILRKTDKGYWISFGFGKKWVDCYSRKRFAYPTKAQAKLNFVKRTDRYRRMLSFKVKVCEMGLKMIENWDGKVQNNSGKLNK